MRTFAKLLWTVAVMRNNCKQLRRVDSGAACRRVIAIFNDVGVDKSRVTRLRDSVASSRRRLRDVGGSHRRLGENWSHADDIRPVASPRRTPGRRVHCAAVPTR